MRGGLRITLQLYHGLYVLHFNSYLEDIKSFWGCWGGGTLSLLANFGFNKFASRIIYFLPNDSVTLCIKLENKGLTLNQDTKNRHVCLQNQLFKIISPSSEYQGL